MQNNNSSRTVIITGANRGIGYSTVEGLLAGNNAYDILLGSRSLESGQKAAEELRKKHSNSNSKVTAVELDITNLSSVEKFLNWVSQERGNKIDVLINNAGVGYIPQSKEENLNYLTTNFDNTLRFTERILPLLADDGKIITLSSQLGALSYHSQKAQTLLSDSSLTKDKLVAISKELYDTTNTGKKNQWGFIDNLYYASKALLNAYDRFVLIKSLKPEQQLYTVCPGWCRTDMGTTSATRSVEQGADTPVYLTNLPFKRDAKLQGEFLQDRKPFSW